MVPFPGHLLVSFFSPWKEQSWSGYPTGVPRKELLGFDTVRMMGPWRSFVTEELKQGRLPTWNPHQFGGAPMLANGQSAVWFPLNWLYLFLPFSIAWTILVTSQPIIATLCMRLFLRARGHSELSALVVSLFYGFSAWMSVWMEWNIHGFAYALLPLGLFAIHKKKKIVFILSVLLIILSGHPQVAYICLFALASYAFFEKVLRWTLKWTAIALLLSLPHVFPLIQYYKEANREIQSSEFTYSNTVFYWRQLPQLLAPNFFGNPATGNFQAKASFVETTMSIGVGAIIFAFFGIGVKRKRSYAIFLLCCVALLSFPGPITRLISIFNIPFISSSLASRWILLVPCALSLLAAPGIDFVLSQKERSVWKPLGVLAGIFLFLWIWIAFGGVAQRAVTAKNFLIPSGIVMVALTMFFAQRIVKSNKKIKKNYFYILVVVIGALSLIDLLLFSWKTMTYTEARFIYPTTPVLAKLQELSKDGSRFASSADSVIESNFATQYGLYDLSGYDALYPRRIGELVWAAHNNGQIISDFSRSTVVMPTAPSTARDNLWNLSGVRWILNKDDLLGEHPDQYSHLFPKGPYQLIWEEGKWQIYENMQAFPRAFFMADSQWLQDDQAVISQVLKSPISLMSLISPIPARLEKYEPTVIEISVDAPEDGYVVLTDTHYPGWDATVDGKPEEILPAFYAFRAVPVKKGSHTVKFMYQSL